MCTFTLVCVCMTYCMSLRHHSLGESEAETAGKALGKAGANVKPETCNSELDRCNMKNNSSDLQNERCCRCATMLSAIETTVVGNLNHSSESIPLNQFIQ